MKKLTEYVRQSGKSSPLLTLVAGELGRNLKDVGQFFNTEMKSALKPDSFGPFAGAKAFVNRVAVKFDQLEDALSRDGEKFSSLRALLVSDSHFDILQTAVNDLGSAEEICSSDGKKHDYMLCTLKGLVDFRLHKGVTGEVFRFRL